MITQSERVAIIIEEFYRCGLTEFCTAPGSRNTPLLLAGLENKAMNFRVFHDERSMAFFALGMARRGKTIPVVLTTSGTAVANLLPATIEAEADSVSMILISADRPASQLEKGANQTIVQTGIFGAKTSTLTIDENLSGWEVLDMISAIRQKLSDEPGPIHINLPLQKPLLEVADLSSAEMNPMLRAWYEKKEPWTTFDIMDRRPEGKSDLTDFDAIIVGANPMSARAAIERITNEFNGDTFFDIQSGSWTCGSRPLSAEVFGKAEPGGEKLLIIGHRFTEHRVWDWVSKFDYVEQWKTVTGVFDPKDLIDKSFDIGWKKSPLLDELPLPLGEDWGGGDQAKLIAQKEKTVGIVSSNNPLVGAKSPTQERGQKLCYSRLVSVIFSSLEQFENVHLANSLTVRAFDRFRTEGDFLRSSSLTFNRGASGIDGTLATGLGVAYDGSPALVVCGDHALLYDLSLLPDLHNLEIQTTVIIVDNKGGRIFDHLSIVESNALEKYFVAAPKANLAAIISSFGFSFEEVDTTTALKETLDSSYDGIRFIIANVDPEFDLKDFSARTEERFS